jgi:hypothetical protein
MNMRERRKERKKEDEELPVPWQRIQGAIWLVGLAILFWQGWFWPGILILAAISGIFQAGVQLYLSRQAEAQKQAAAVQQQIDERANWLPSTCPKCGAPISVQTVQWTGPNTADCPYCKANLRPA